MAQELLEEEEEEEEEVGKNHSQIVCMLLLWLLRTMTNLGFIVRSSRVVKIKFLCSFVVGII